MNSEKRRKNSNTTLDQNLYFKIKLISVITKININELLEDGMKYIIDKYDYCLPEEYKKQNIEDINKIG